MDTENDDTNVTEDPTEIIRSMVEDATAEDGTVPKHVLNEASIQLAELQESGEITEDEAGELREELNLPPTTE